MELYGNDGGRFTGLCTTGPKGHPGKAISNLLNLSAVVLGQVAERIHPFFNSVLCIFHHTEEAISFAAQVAVVFCLLVQLEREGGLQGCSNTSGQNKSFLRRHPVTRLPVNDTSSSYSSRNDLVCVALLVVRETAGGESGNESGHCLEMQAGTPRDRDKDREKGN